MCFPCVHTGPSGCHRYSPGSHSFRLSLVLCTPQQSRVDQAVLTLFSSTILLPFPSTLAPIPSVSRCICAWGVTRRESRAAGLGHKVQEGPALAPDPSGQLEILECPWPLCGKGSPSLANHPACQAAAHQPDLP